MFSPLQQACETIDNDTQVAKQLDGLVLNDPNEPSCYILKLPDEVLDEILIKATAWPDDIDGSEYRQLYATRHALTLVCRRFHRLTMPILYSRIALSLRHIINRKVLPSDVFTRQHDDLYDDLSPGWEFNRLHRTLEANPSLRSLCTDVVFDLEETRWNYPEFLSQGKDLVTWFTNTTSLRLHDGYGSKQVEQTVKFLELAAATMPRLERLAFSARRTRLNITRLFCLREHITFPNLKALELAGISEADDPYSWEDTEREGRFTELSVRDFFQPEKALQLLMSWPAALEKFTFLGISRFGYQPLNLRSLWSCLVPHMLSLECIRIGSVSNQSPQTPLSDMLTGVDFTYFGCLTSLSLSYWVTGSDSAETCLLAPCLQTFEWTFDAEDQRPLYLDHFQEPEEDFLQRFALAAESRGIPLRNIDIVYTPAAKVGRVESEGVDFLGVSEMALEYPWDRMNRLAAAFLGLGIELAYSRPSVVREEYDVAVLIFGRGR